MHPIYADGENSLFLRTPRFRAASLPPLEAKHQDPLARPPSRGLHAFPHRPGAIRQTRTTVGGRPHRSYTGGQTARRCSRSAHPASHRSNPSSRADGVKRRPTCATGLPISQLPERATAPCNFSIINCHITQSASTPTPRGPSNSQRPSTSGKIRPHLPLPPPASRGVRQVRNLVGQRHPFARPDLGHRQTRRSRGGARRRARL